MFYCRCDGTDETKDGSILGREEVSYRHAPLSKKDMRSQYVYIYKFSDREVYGDLEEKDHMLMLIHQVISC